MSDMDAQMPLVPLAGSLRIETVNGQRMLVIGPVALGIPLSDDTEAWLLSQLGSPASKLVIASPADMPR